MTPSQNCRDAFRSTYSYFLHCHGNGAGTGRVLIFFFKWVFIQSLIFLNFTLTFLLQPDDSVCHVTKPSLSLSPSPYSQHVGHHAAEERVEGRIGAEDGGEKQHGHGFSSEHALVPLLPPLPRRLRQQHLHVRRSTHTHTSIAKAKQLAKDLQLPDQKYTNELDS